MELQAGLDVRREPGMTCHVLRHVEPDPDVLGRGEKNYLSMSNNVVAEKCDHFGMRRGLALLLK